MPSGGPDSPQPGAQPQYLAPATHAQGGREQAETSRRNSPRPLTGGVSPYRFSLCAIWCGVNVHGMGGVPISSPGRAAYAPRLWHAREMTAARGLDTPAMPCRTSRRAKSVLGALLEQIEGGCSRQAVRATRPRLGGSAIAFHLPGARAESALNGKCLVETLRSRVSTHCLASGTTLRALGTAAGGRDLTCKRGRGRLCHAEAGIPALARAETPQLLTSISARQQQQLLTPHRRCSCSSSRSKAVKYHVRVHRGHHQQFREGVRHRHQHLQ